MVDGGMLPGAVLAADCPGVAAELPVLSALELQHLRALLAASAAEVAPSKVGAKGVSALATRVAAASTVAISDDSGTDDDT